VTIGKLEAYVADYVRRNYGHLRRERAASTGRRVAVIGGGPAGMTVAEELAVRGHGVTVYEMWPMPGGLLLYGIPNFKLDKDVVLAKLEHLHELGVQFVCNYHAGKEHPVEDLLRAGGGRDRGYDLLFLGYGAVKGGAMRIEGETLKNVYQATEYLVRGNLPPELLPKEWSGDADPKPHVGKVTVVVGAGDTAMDCVRTARRLNPETQVYCLYRRTEAEMLGRMEERVHAKEEGVIFECLTLPTRFVGKTPVGGKNGEVIAAECVRMELGPPDAKGRRSPVEIKGSEFTIACDTAVLAIGYNAETEIPETTPELHTTKWGTVVVKSEETGETEREDIYAAGDAVRGADLVVTALAAARKAAAHMDAKLSRNRAAA